MQKRRLYRWLALPWIIGLALMAYIIAMTFHYGQVMLQYPEAYCETPGTGFRIATLHLDDFCFRNADADVLNRLHDLSFVGLALIVVPALILAWAKQRERKREDALYRGR